MVQKEIGEDVKEEWIKDETFEDAEVVKLEIGECIQGLLVDKFDSVRYNAGIYKIKDKDDKKIKVIIGTTILDKLMKPKEIGEEVKIKRLEDGKARSGVVFQNYETYHLHRSSSR